MICSVNFHSFASSAIMISFSSHPHPEQLAITMSPLVFVGKSNDSGFTIVDLTSFGSDLISNVCLVFN